MPRLNLVTNPSFRNGTVGWSAINGASIAAASGFAVYGSESLRVTKAAVTSSGFESAAPFAVIAGLSYAASAYLLVPIVIPVAQNSNVVLKLVWRNSLGVILSESASAIATISPSSAHYRLSGVFSAPAGATFATLSISQLAAGTAGQIFYVDAVLVEQSAYVGGYLDNLSQAEETRITNRALTPYQNKTIGGMQLNADIILNTLVLNTIDETNTLWVCTDIDGWWVNAAPEVPSIPRGVEDGDYDVSGRNSSRTITLSGVFIPESPAALGAARDRLIQAISLVREGAWLRTNESPTKAAYVRLSGRPQINTVNARGRTEFSVSLRASDPIKYEWNDNTLDGVSVVTIQGSTGSGVVTNIGTTRVTSVFRIEGPLDAGSKIYNATTDETLTLTRPLRGASTVATITTKEIYKNIATLETTASHGLMVGDNIYISNVGAPFDSVNQKNIVTFVSDQVPYRFSYSLTNLDISYRISGGQVSLAQDDVLIVDTYNKNVVFNNEMYGHRRRVDVLVDWIKLAPGSNLITLTDNIRQQDVDTKSILSNTVTLKTLDAHQINPGEFVTVALPVARTLFEKSLTTNVVTLTTTENHGYSVGDLINVTSTENSLITSKSLTTNVATLITAVDGGFAVGDTITVTTPVTQEVAQKTTATNVATLFTVAPHGFSLGDSVTVALPFTASISSKSLTNNLAVLGTVGPHSYSVGDSINVVLPTTSTVVNKATSGSSVLLTTAAAHGFSAGDTITVAFPVTTTLSGTRSMSGNPTNLVTLNTATAHGYAVGDRILVDINMPTTAAVTSRTATATVCTLTTSVAHSFAVGSRIVVSGVSARYNTEADITAVTATTVVYNFSGAAEGVTATTGSILNTTISLGYNGNEIIETIPSTTSFTYYYGPQTIATSSTVYGATPTATNQTNTSLNGTKVITAVPTSTQFSYTK